MSVHELLHMDMKLYMSTCLNAFREIKIEGKSSYLPHYPLLMTCHNITMHCSFLCSIAKSCC